MPKITIAISPLLTDCRTIAVVGLSAKSSRPSHEVAQYMQSQGYRIIPVNPTYARTYILGELCYTSVREAAARLAQQDVKIDMVNCFRKSEAIVPIAEEAIAINVRCLWMQLGVINREAAARASAAGIQVVMDRCIKIEHMHAGLG